MGYVGAIIGAAGALGATAINAGSTGKTNKASRRFINWQYDKQRQDALTDWDTQNQYNSPAEEMKRLKAAGLNPHLVYGQGATASNAGPVRNTNMGSWSPDAPQVDPGAIGETIGNFHVARTNPIQTSILQTNLANAEKQGELIDAEILNKHSDTALKGSTKARAEWDLALEDELRNYTSSRRKSETHTAANIVDKTADEAKITRKERENKSTEIDLANKYKSLSNDEKTQQIAKIKQEISNLGLDARLKEYETKLNDRGINKSDPMYWRVLKLVQTKAFDALDRLFGIKRNTADIR